MTPASLIAERRQTMTTDTAEIEGTAQAAIDHYGHDAARVVARKLGYKRVTPECQRFWFAVWKAIHRMQGDR